MVAKTRKNIDTGRDEEIVEVPVVLTRDSFVGEGESGHIELAGSQLIIETTLDKHGEPRLGANMRVATEADNAPRALIPMASIGPASPSATVPQGLPPGSVQVGNLWLAPMGDGKWGEVVPATDFTDPLLAATHNAQADRAAIESRSAPDSAEPDMTNAQLRQAILDAGGAVQPASANKAELQAALKEAQAAKA